MMDFGNYRDEIINLDDPDKLNIRHAETLGNYLKNVVSDFENFHFFFVFWVLTDFDFS